MIVRAVKKLKEKQEFFSKAGAGEDGTTRLKKTYQKDTPGQLNKTITSFKEWMNTK